ncbi:TenA family transcriptional regulator [Candidatus Poriferisocius sp.]|uniref:TenA family transcriptional regulator n=1 Tax=Candidatus Poriferisocius sp. TaxID=3101276 RepID=UPI003B5A5400
MAHLLSEDDFRVALQDAMSGREAKDASFSQAWAQGKLQRKHFARWAENHYHYVGPFADYLAYIYANTPDSAASAKDFLLQNMWEEEIGDIRHTELLIRFAEACGTTRQAVEDPRNITAVTRGLQSWCYAVAFREHFTVATAALVVGLESQVPSIYRKQLPPLLDPDVYGFTEDEAEFFDLHITSDEIHGERGFQIVVQYADTPDLQQRCIEITRDGADMRFAYTKALYDTYVAPDLGDWQAAPEGELLGVA